MYIIDLMIWPKPPKLSKTPRVSVLTPTYNRRPFIPYCIKCLFHQTYSKALIEWIIIDDGDDKIGDLVTELPCVKYVPIDKKMTLGAKRNMLNRLATGEILIYWDDDDYYPPGRIEHIVSVFKQNPKSWAGGSSSMQVYFSHNKTLYQFGPYGPKHATAATMAIRRELLNYTKYDDVACLAEEKKFLMDFTVPLVQFETKHSIMVSAHSQNTINKRELLENGNIYIHITELTVDDFFRGVAADVREFYLNVDAHLEGHDGGDKTDNIDYQTNMREKIHVEMEKEYMGVVAAAFIMEQGEKNKK